MALNQERAAEEARGHIRWLRPDYQVPKLGKKAPQPGADQTVAELVQVEPSEAPKWPSDGLDQIRAVQSLLATADAPLAVPEISANFKGGRKRAERIEAVLAHMVEVGIVRRIEEGEPARYFAGR